LPTAPIGNGLVRVPWTVTIPAHNLSSRQIAHPESPLPIAASVGSNNTGIT